MASLKTPEFTAEQQLYCDSHESTKGQVHNKVWWMTWGYVVNVRDAQ
jgi:hypothetical protein